MKRKTFKIKCYITLVNVQKCKRYNILPENRRKLRDTYLKESIKANTPQLIEISTYINPEGILLEVLVLDVVVGHGVGVEAGEAALLQPLPQVGHPQAGAHQVHHEHHQHKRLGGGLVEPGAHHVAEELHQPVLLVVLKRKFMSCRLHCSQELCQLADLGSDWLFVHYCVANQELVDPKLDNDTNS